MTHDLQPSLDSGHDFHVIAIDFSSVFDVVNCNTLFINCSCLVLVKILVFSMTFLANSSQCVVDGACSHSLPVISSFPQDSVLGLLLFIIFTSDLEIDLENKLIAYASVITLLLCTLSE